MSKLLVITGPTATGKTALGIRLAKKLDGEIISADSRQVYRGMDIGTGKDKEDYQKTGVEVWGIDLVDPVYNFNVSDFVKYSADKIVDVQSRGNLPIIIGGTVLYLKSLLNPPETLNIPQDQNLRKQLEKYSLAELQHELQKIDPLKWQKMNSSDRNNPRRLVRAIEVEYSPKYQNTPKLEFDPFIISLTAPLSFLYKKIDERVDKRVGQGIIQEIQSLLDKGCTWDLPSMSASGYKEFKEYFLKVNSYQLKASLECWKFHEHAYARRQLTFLRKFLADQKSRGTKVVEINISSPGISSQLGDLSDQVERWYTSSDG